MNGAYHVSDMTPLGRQEDGLSYTMAWVERVFEYSSTAGVMIELQRA